MYRDKPIIPIDRSVWNGTTIKTKVVPITEKQIDLYRRKLK